MKFRESNLAHSIAKEQEAGRSGPKRPLKLVRRGPQTAEGVIEIEDRDIEYPEEQEAISRAKSKHATFALTEEAPLAKRVQRIERGRRATVGEKTRSEAKAYGVPEEEITEVESLTPLEEELYERAAGRKEEGKGAFEELRIADEKTAAAARRREELFAARQLREQPGREAVSMRIREREERIEALKQNVAEIRAGMERMEAEAKARQDAEGAARAGRIGAALEEQNARIEELRSLERSIATGQAELGERMREGALLRSDGGEVIGLKNVFEATPGDVLRATAPALRRIQEQHLWAQDHLRGGWRERVLHDLETEVSMWAKMAEQAMADQNAGNKGEEEKPTVANLFYRRPEAGAVPVAVQETITRSPMEALRDRYDALSEREEELADVFQREREAYAAVLEAIDGKQSVVNALERMQEVSEALDETYGRTLKRLNAEYEEAKREAAGGDVDERGLAISRNLERAEAEAKRMRMELKTFKGSGELKEELEAAEERILELRGERRLWKESPQRELALKQRRERLQARAEDLLNRIAEIELMQQANRQAAEQRALILERQVSEALETPLLAEQLVMSETNYVGAGSDYYEARQERRATLQEILKRSLAEKERRAWGASRKAQKQRTRI